MKHLNCIDYLENSFQRYPNNIAVNDSVNSLTFNELRSNAINIDKNIKSSYVRKPIGVFMPKSTNSIISFMGIMYSGNFYCPIDTKSPKERILKIIDNLQCEFILTNDETYELANQITNDAKLKIQILKIEDCIRDNGLKYSFPEIIDTDPLYCIYTSGSTGIPKGVVISHRSVVDYIDWATELYKVDEHEIIGNQAPLHFDNSTLDIYLAIKNGCRLEIIPEIKFLSPVQLMDYIRDQKINFIFWVPSVMIAVANSETLKNQSQLKKVLFAGEVMPNKQLNYWRSMLKDCLFSNLYGPTEITVDCTYYLVEREFSDDEPLPIGFARKNSDILILSEENQLITSPHKMGELCVRGSLLGLGYWRDPIKTEAAFCQNPLHNNYPEKIYRTGDIVQYNEYNEIIYVGRRDSQIKHQGYRIDLGEIETNLNSFENIDNCCVIYDSFNKKIIAIYESAKGELDVIELRKKLITKLPKYMMPGTIEYMEKLPLNANGKIDRITLSKKYGESND